MDDEHFLARLRDHDPEAQKKLIREFNPRIFIYFRNRIKGGCNFEDLVQDVFGAFFRGLDQGKLTGTAWIAPFMFGIAKRVLFNYFYKQRKHNEIQRNLSGICDLSSDFTEAERLDNLKLSEELNRLIAGLPQIDRVILNAFYLEERSLGEISAMTGRSKHYISVRKERAIKKIRNEIFRRNVYR
ncbi:MAG: sigma-70 family RNA polymerase sigma factor [Candidatus Aminicenantes bacterium]|nr:sigma-70 family RNA polymerase sigma factor [Candidatus Aminicenantes bacterium]